MPGPKPFVKIHSFRIIIGLPPKCRSFEQHSTKVYNILETCQLAAIAQRVGYTNSHCSVPGFLNGRKLTCGSQRTTFNSRAHDTVVHRGLFDICISLTMSTALVVIEVSVQNWS